MKKIYFAALTLSLMMSSCGTLFTSSKQDITFTGNPGTAIYDKGKKIAEIDNGGTATVKIKKSLSSKSLIAKNEGYQNTPVEVESTFNPISVLNLLNVIAWAVDLGTGKCCKYSTEVIEIPMAPLQK